LACSAAHRANIAPRERRTDNLSVAFHNLDADARTDLTHRFEALCAHYDYAGGHLDRGEFLERAGLGPEGGGGVAV